MEWHHLSQHLEYPGNPRIGTVNDRGHLHSFLKWGDLFAEVAFGCENFSVSGWLMNLSYL